ncbi:MAG: cytochrome c biogenesis protein CcdA [Bacteroidota bacterium]
MKHIFRLSILLLVAFSILNNVNAQIVIPIKWDFNAKKVSECEYELILKAQIEANWHLYGQKLYGDEGPIPTSFRFTKSPDYDLTGKTSESKLIKKFEPIWNFELEFFEHEAVFKQKIKVKTDKAFEIKGDLEYMVCNETQCLPPTTVNYTFKVQGASSCIASSLPTSVNAALPSQCDSNAIFLASAKNNAAVVLPVDTASTSIASVETKTETETPETTSGRSWWAIFITGFLGGLAALLTPCVFPMIPMTVSFFTKSSKTRAKGISNALIYGASIIVIYVLLGLGVTKAFGPDALNALSTNVWFNLAFFVLLVVFAISFLGAFEIVLPSSFINKVDARSDRGGMIGIFLMAFTLSLVSFSCTGPIIGTLLVDAAVNGGLEGPFWGMFGFSAALALPFGLFAAFPGWLNTLPKSGGWLNSVKVVLGFLELALALKFASNADLVVQAGILTREIFIAIWIVIFGLMGIYLMGWIKLSHDSPLHHLSVTRLFMAIITFSFTLYLIPGLWGAPLKLISGFPPPDFYSESPQGFGAQNTSTVPLALTDNKNEAGHAKEHCPNNLPCFHDYDEALAYAKKVNKPLMIDFTGWACVNCRKMESQVWTDPEVDKRIRNEVVLVSLYVDDKTELPKDQQTTKKLGDLEFNIKSIGNKWSYLQANLYKTNTQPQYILIDNNEKMLTSKTAHYDSNIQKYVNWLDEGINEFKKRK